VPSPRKHPLRRDSDEEKRFACYRRWSQPSPLLTTLSRAQLLTGTVSTVGGSSSCPVYNSQNQPTGWIPGTICQNATITGLLRRRRQSTSRLAMSRRHRAHTRGPFCFFSSAGGESPGDDDLPTLNLRALLPSERYEIVPSRWTEGPWSRLMGRRNQPFCGSVPSGDFHSTGLQQSSTFQGTAQNRAGYCAQGEARGSAQIAYSLALYGSGTYLDKVELLSGPVLSDLEQGCEVNQTAKGRLPLPSAPRPKPLVTSAAPSRGPYTPEVISMATRGAQDCGRRLQLPPDTPLPPN